MVTVYTTPILLICFNRLDTVQRVFKEIRNVQPKRLFIACDGARQERVGEVDQVAEVRAWIVDHIDWECDVKTLFRDQNLGCRQAVSSAIDWFFSQVEMGVILEDDCVPHPTFFSFCQELLVRYKDDSLVMHIGGNNFQEGKKRGGGSYYFSLYSHIWGWATWRRAWALYDVSMKSFPEFKKKSLIKNIWKDVVIQKIWMNRFDSVYTNTVDTWDYQWTYALWDNNGVAIVPNVNLVTNIGFGEHATHTKTKHVVANMPVEPMEEVIHPSSLSVNTDADVYYSQSLKMHKRIINKIRAYLS